MPHLSPQDLVEEARRQVQVVDLGRAYQMYREGACFIDVREPLEWLAGYIAGAERLPRGLLEFQVGKRVPDLEQSIVTYCGAGPRAILATAQLKRLGYADAAAMSGGFRAWKKAGYPRRFNPLVVFT